jgi:outer membrane protein TolC
MNKTKKNVLWLMIFLFSASLPAWAQQQPLTAKLASPPQSAVQSQSQVSPPPQAQPQTQNPPGALLLAQVVDLALAHSPDLALARARVNVANNVAGIDRAEFHPNLYTGSGAQYSNGFPQTPGGAAPAVFEMTYQQALFNPQKRGEQHADEDLARNQQLEYDNMRNSVMVQAASAYLELAAARHSLDLLRTERDSEQQILDVARQRAQAGLELPVSVTQDELQLAKIDQRIVQFESRDEILSDQLRDMTGLPADQALVVSPAEQLVSPPAVPASNLLGLALESSPAIKEAENERSAKEHLLKGARGSYWPTIDIVGVYSVLSKINNYDEFFKAFQRNNVNAGLQITIPLFAAKTSSNVALARSEVNEADLNLSNQRRDVRIGTETKIRTLREMEAGKEVARLDLQLAQEQLQDEQAKFDQGRATLEDLEQARVTENEKWLAFLDADLAREKAQLDLLQATGQLAQVFH